MKKILLIFSLFFLLFSCWENNHKNTKTQITTSIIPLSSITNYIWWENFLVKNIVWAWKSPHNFSLKTSHLVDLENSKWIIVVWLEHIDWFLDKKINGKNVLKLSEKLKDSEPSSEWHFEKNPHIWTSPENAKIIAEKIKNFLAKIQKENKEIFIKNYENFIKKIDNLVENFREKTNWKKQQYFIVFHNAYDYLFKDLKIDISKKIVFKKSILNNPNSSELQNLTDKISKYNIKNAFIEPQFKNSNFEKIAKKYNLEILTLDPLGSDENTNWYLKNLENNLWSLEKIFE